MHRAAAAILLLLAAGADTGPAATKPDLAFQCSATCEGGGGKFAYEVGSTYSYEYRTDSATSLSGTGDAHQQDEGARLHVAATADISVLSRCEFSLQVRDATLEESASRDALRRTPSARHQEFSDGVSAHALRFSFQDGRVAQICASSRDPPWAVNFKRGLLSAFQNSMASLDSQEQSLTETDVSGECETQYSVAAANGSTVVVRKVKNLRSCSNRVDHFLSLPSAPYNSPARSLPLIRSDQSCEQTVAAGLLTGTSCEETHLFRPFSNGGNGAVTRVAQQLVLSDVSRRDGPEHAVESPLRASLLFHHPASTTTATAATVEDVVTTLGELGRLTDDGVQSEAPRTFSRLVQSLRTMNHSRMSQVFHLVQDSYARKFFLDAMPLLSTADSMVLMVELLSSGEISEEEGDSWLQSLTFQTRPTVDMLEALLPLLAGQPRPKPMLAVSSLVHSYCTTDPDCQDVLQVRSVVSRLEQLLGRDCRTSTRKAEDLVLHALKAIGNAGVLVGSTDTLRRCYQTNSSIEVRLAAISAHRRLACDEAASSHMLYAYSDLGEDAEVRIAAYLAAMRCPSERTIERIKDVLYSEDVSQVASFVWTHLTNLQETSSPSKQSIKELIANDFLHNKFSTDVRKFSRNYEASAFSEALNFGGTAESNVVFSPGSYLPRSASLNLTVDLFGEAVNILELGGRVEGFENYVEGIFAPGGLFPEKSIRNLLQKLRKDSKKTQEQVGTSIGQDVLKDTRIPKPPTASLYTRIFGNELKYSHFNGLEDIAESLGKFTSTKQLLSKLLNEKPIDYSKSLVFVDASYVIPTLAGFPLEFTVNGSATVDLKVSGHVDVDGMWTKGDVDIKGHVMPSLAVEFSGMMSVDAFASRAGILSVSRLHSNTLVDGRLKVRGRKLVEMKVNVPRDKVEVLEVSSKLLLVRGDQGDQKLQEIKGVQKDKEERKWCTPSSISTLTGMKVCTELSYPNATRVPFSPYFPLTGPFIFRTWLEKTDSFSSYDLSYQRANSQYENVYQFSADTPGSRVNRRLKFLYFLNTKDRAVKLNVIVPGFKLEAGGKLEDTAKRKGFDLSILFNDDKVVETVGLVQISRTDKVSRYQPFFSLTLMNRKLLEITGRVHHVDGSKFSADLVAAGITTEPILISGDMTVDEGGLGLEASLNSSLLDGSLYADLRQSGNSTGAMAGLTYVFSNSTEEHSVTFSARTLATDDGPFKTRSASASLHSTNLPQYDLDASLSWQVDASGDEMSAKFRFGKLDWQAKYTDSYQRRPASTELVKALYLKCPEIGLDTAMELLCQRGPQGHSYSVRVSLTPELTMTGTYVWSQPHYGERLASLLVSLPWLNGSAQGAVSWPQRGKLSGLLRAQLTDWRGTTRSLGLAGSHVDHSTPWTTDLSLQLEAEGVLEFQASAGFASTQGRAVQWTELTANGETYTANVIYIHERSHKLTAMASRRNGTQYSGSLECLLEPEHMKLVLELQLQKTFSFTSEVKSSADERRVEVAVFWDKNGDASKTASLLIGTTAREARASLVVQKQYISAEMNFTENGAEGELQWTGGKKIRGRLLTSRGPGLGRAEVSVTTPFAGFENQSAVFGYRQQDSRTNVTGEVLWRDKNVEFSVETVCNCSSTGNIDVGAEVHLASSFPALRAAAARFSHVYGRAEAMLTETKLSLEFNDERADFTSRWDISNSKTEGSISLETPWKCVQHATAEVKLDYSDILSLVFADLRWNNDVNATVDFSYDTKLRARGALEVSKLLREYGELSAEMLLEASDSVFDLEARATMLPFEASLEVNRDANTSLRVNGLISTAALRKWEVNVDSERHVDGKLTGVLDVKKDGNSIARFNAHGKVVSLYHDSELHMAATLPRNVLTYTLINHFDSSHSKSSFQASWNEAKLEASVDGMFAEEARKVSSKYEAVLSGTLLKRDLKMTLSHESEPNKLAAVLQVPEMASISYHFISETLLNWEFVLQLNSSRVNGSITQRLAHSPSKNFLATFAAECNGEELTAGYQCVMEPWMLRAVGSLATPWTSPIHLELDLKHSNSALKTDFLLKYGSGKQINLDGNVFLDILEGQVHFQFASPFTTPLLLRMSYDVAGGMATAIVQWGEARIDAGAFLNISETSCDVKLQVLTPFESWENITLVGSYDETEAGTKVTASVGRNSDAVILIGLANITPDNFRLLAKLTSPSVKFKSFVVDCKSDMNNFDLVYEHNGVTVELTGKYQLDSKSNGTAEVRLKTPSKIVEDLGIRLWYDLEHINVGFVAHKNSEQVQAVMNSNERRTEIQVTSPFKIIEESSISIRHEYVPGEKLTINMVLNYNKNTIHAAGYASKPDNNSMTASLEVRTPFIGFEKLRADYSFSGLLNNQKHSAVTLSKNGKRFDIAASLNFIDDLQADLKLKIDTPFVGYESIVGGLSYNITKNGINGDASGAGGNLQTFYELAGSKKAVIVSFAVSSSAVSANVTTSFESFKSASLAGSVETDGGDCSVYIRATWNEHLFNGNLTSWLGLAKSDNKLHVATSLPGFEDVVFRLGHNFLGKEKTVYAHIRLNDASSTELNLSGFFEPESGRITLSAHTPLNCIRTVAVGGNYSLFPDMDREFHLTMNTNNYNLGIHVANSEHQTTVQIETPLDELQYIVLTCKHRFHIPALVSLTVENGGSHTLFDTSLQVTQRKAELKVISPFKPYKKFDIVSDIQKIVGEEPGYSLSVVALENSEKIFDTDMRIILDWTSKIGINITRRTPHSDEVCVSAWTTPEFPPSNFNLVATRGRTTFASLEGAVEDVRDGGFTFRAKSYTPYATRDMALHYYPKDIVVKFASDMGVLFDKATKVQGELNYDKKGQSLTVLSKVVTNGNEKKFLLSCSYNQNRILAELRTPIPSFEKFTIDGRSSVGSDSSKTFNISAYKNEQGLDIAVFYNLNIDFSNVLISAEVPFFILEKFNLDFQHNFRDTKKTASLNLLVGSQLITADGSISLGNLSSEIDVKINTPLEYFRNVSFESKYDFSGAVTKDFRLVSEVNGSKYVEVVFGVDHAASVGSIMLYINGPREALVKGNYDFSNDAEYYAMDVSVEESSQVLFDFSAQLKKDVSHGEVNAGIFGKELEFGCEYRNTPRAKKLSTRLTLGKNITHGFDAMLKRREANGVEASLGVHLPYSQSYVVHVHWDSFNVANPAGKVSIKWPEQKYIFLQSSLALGSIDDPITFNFTGNSSVKTNEELNFETKITITDSFTLESAINMNGQNVFAVNLQSKYSSPMSYVTCALKSSFTSPMHGRLGYSFTRKKSNISAEFEFGSLKLLTLVSSANTKVRDNCEVNLEITAPDTALPKLHFHGTLHLSKSRRDAEVLLESGEKLWKLSFIQRTQQGLSLAVHTPVAHFEDFKFAASVSTSPQEPANLEIIVGKFITVTATCLTSRNAIRFGAHGKLYAYDPVGFEGTLTTGDVFHSLLTLTFDNKEIVLNLHVDFVKQKNAVVVDSVLKCPWMDDVTVVGHFKSDSEKDSQITVTRGENVITVKGNLKYVTTSNGHNIVLVLFVDDIGTVVTAEIEMGENVGLHLRSTVDPYSFDVKLSRTASNITGHVHLRTPHAFLKEADGSVDMFMGTVEEPRAHLLLALQVNDRSYKLSTNAFYSAGDVSGNVTLLTPDLKFDNIGFVATFKENTLAFGCQIEDTRVGTNLSYRMSWPVYSANLTIDLPHYDTNYVAISTYFHMQDTIDQISWELINRRGFSFLRAKMPKDVFLKLQTQIQVIPDVSITHNIIYRVAMTHKLRGTLKWKTERISLETTSHIHPIASAVHALVTWNDVKKLDLAASYLATGRNLTETVETAFQLSTANGNFSSKLEIDLRTPNTIIAHLAASTPFDSVPDLRAVTNFHRSSDSLRGYVSLTSRNKTLSVRIDTTHENLEIIDMRTEVYIPIEDTPPIELTVRIQQRQWRNLVAFVQVHGFSAEGHANVTYQLQDSRLDGAVLVDTPLFAKEVSFGGSVQYSGLENSSIEGHIDTNKVTLGLTTKDDKETKLDCRIQLPLIDLKDYSFTASVGYGTSKRISVVYKTDDHVGNATLALEVTSRNVSLEACLDIPVLCSSRHMSRVNVEFAGSKHFVELRYEHGDLTDAAVLMFDNGRDLRLSGHIQSSLIGEKEVTLEVGKRLDKLTIDLWKIFQVAIKRDSWSGSINVNAFGTKHALLYGIQTDIHFKGSIYIECPYIRNEKFSISATSDIMYNWPSVTEVSIHSGDQHCKTTVEILSDGIINDMSVTISFNSRPIITSDIKLRSSEHENQLYASLKIFDKTHEASIRLYKFLMYNFEFGISSPCVPGGLVTVDFAVRNGSLVSSIGYGGQEFVPVLTVEATTNMQNSSAFIRIESETLMMFKSLSVRGAFILSDWRNVNVDFEGEFVSKMFPTVKVSGSLIVNENSLDASLSAESSLVGFDQLGCDIHIPLSLSFDFNPRAMVTLPSGHKYGLNVVIRFLSDKMEVGVSGNFRTDIAGLRFATAYGSQGKLELEVNIPLLQPSHFGVYLMGYRTLSDGTDTTNFVEWNENRVELKHAMLMGKDKAILHLGLSTPFENHSIYDVKLQYENRQSKVASILFTLPTLGENIGINLDLTYLNLLDFNFQGVMKLPVSERFETVLFSVRNKVGGQEVNSSVAARYNEEKFEVALSSSFNRKQIKFNASSHINDNVLSLRFEADQKNDSKRQAYLELVTPFTTLRNFIVNITTASNPADGMAANATYNHRQIFDLSLEEDIKSVRSILVQTPWRSVSSMFFYRLEGEFMVDGELCWNVDNREDSLIGLKINLRPRPENRLEVSARLKIPTLDVVVDATYQANPNKVEYMNKFSWEEGQNVGYHLLLDTQNNGDGKQSVFLLRGDLPFRSFELSARNRFDSSDGLHLSAEALWDALGDRTKKMQVSLDAAARQTVALFHHPGLQSDLVLRILKDEKFRIEFEYSPVKENMFVAETCVGFKNVSSPRNTHFIAMFLVQHNASRLNLHFDLEASMIVDREVRGTLTIQYDSRRAEMQILQLAGVANYEVPSAEMHVRTPGNKVSAGVSALKGLDGSHGLRLKTTVNEKQPLSAEVRLNTVHPLLELEVRCGDSRGYSTYMGMPNRRQIVLGARHVLDGQQTVDGLVMVSLNSSRLLWTKVQWRSESLAELGAFLRHEYGDLPAIADSVAQHFGDFFEEDFAGKLAAMCAPLQEAYDNIKLHFTNYYEETCTNIRDSLTELRVMYHRNDFKLKALFTFLGDSITYLRVNVQLVDDLVSAVDFFWRTVVVEPFHLAVEFVSSAPAAVQTLLGDIQAVAAPVLRRTFQLAKEVFGRCRPKAALREALEATRVALLGAERVLQEALSAVEAFVAAGAVEYSRLAEPYLAALEDASGYVNDSLELLYHRLQEMLDVALNAILGERELERLAELYEKYASWLEEVHLQGQMDHLQELATNSSKAVLSKVEDILVGYKEWMTSILSSALVKVSHLADMPEIAYITDITNFVFQKARWAWRYYEAGDRLKEGLHNAASNLDTLLTDLVHSLGEGASSPAADDAGWQVGTLVVRPGLVEFAQALPVDWPGFDEAPRLQQLTLPPLARSQRLIEDPAPPFLDGPRSTTALLVGGRRFVTFDGKFFDFVGNCTYLLAADLEDSQYSIFITYHGKEGSAVRKSLTVVVDEQRIELGEDGQVRLGGRKTELPAAAGTSALLWRRGDAVMVDALRHGLRLQCDLREDACSLQVSDRHHGRVSGLLGAFQGQVEGHARRWRVDLDASTGARCEQTGPEESRSAAEDPRVVEACDELFRSLESPLRPCYGMLDPSPFYSMCVVDAGDGPCPSSSVYFAQCRAAGVQVSLPPECVKCALRDGSELQLNETRMLDPDRPEGADVVLVVERAACLGRLNLRELTEKLYAGMALRGLEEVLYAVVSFGPGQPPESHTAQGQLWSSHRTVRHTLRTLTYSSSTSEQGSNALEALHYATRLGFREGASRTVVLVQCGPCRAEDGYAPLVSQLLSQRAALHVLEPDTVLLAHNTTKASKVYGLDARGAYTGRNVKTLRPSPTLRRQVKLPKDQCTPAALETGGTLFNLAHLFPDQQQGGSHNGAAKKFLDVWARRVSANARPASCQRCECRLGPDGVGQTFCDECPRLRACSPTAWIRHRSMP